MICALLLFCAQIIAGDVPAYVDAVARFDAPAIVLTAHNNLDGQYFNELQTGDLLRYHDGTAWEDYRIEAIRPMQALQPDSTRTYLLEDGSLYSVEDIHRELFADPDTLVLMTCIERDGRLNWGRLFVIARRLE
jgi:hypothetical protein